MLLSWQFSAERWHIVSPGQGPGFAVFHLGRGAERRHNPANTVAAVVWAVRAATIF
jgi:hypothetical protein